MTAERTALVFRLTLVTAAALWLAVPAAGGLAAQSPARIRVWVRVEDDSIGGVISSAFRSAFRALGDVDVVTAAETADVGLEGIVLCNGECDSNWSAVHMSLRVFTPVSRNLLVQDLTLAGIRAADSSVARLSWYLALAQYTRQTWITYWGRAKYEGEARNVVATIDSQCLEAIRTKHRIDALPRGKVRDDALKGWLAQDKTSIC